MLYRKTRGGAVMPPGGIGGRGLQGPPPLAIDWALSRAMRSVISRFDAVSSRTVEGIGV